MTPQEFAEAVARALDSDWNFRGATAACREGKWVIVVGVNNCTGEVGDWELALSPEPEWHER